MNLLKYLLFPVLAVALLLTACVTKNPDQSPGAPAYVADQARLDRYKATADSALDTARPYNPYDGIARVGLDLAFGIAAGVSLLVAKAKSGKLKDAESAIDTMSLGVVNAGPSAVAKVQEVAAASKGKDAAIVHNALNENLP